MITNYSDNQIFVLLWWGCELAGGIFHFVSGINWNCVWKFVTVPLTHTVFQKISEN